MICYIVWTLFFIAVYLGYAYVQSVVINKLIRRRESIVKLMILAPILSVALIYYSFYGLVVALKIEYYKREKK